MLAANVSTSKISIFRLKGKLLVTYATLDGYYYADPMKCSCVLGGNITPIAESILLCLTHITARR